MGHRFLNVVSAGNLTLQFLRGLNETYTVVSAVKPRGTWSPETCDGNNRPLPSARKY